MVTVRMEGFTGWRVGFTVRMEGFTGWRVGFPVRMEGVTVSADSTRGADLRFGEEGEQTRITGQAGRSESGSVCE